MRKSKVVKLPRLPASSVLILLFLFGAFYSGYAIGEKSGSSAPKNESVKITVSSGTVKTDPNQNLDVDFSLFWDAIDVAKSKYIDIKDVSDKDFLYGAIEGAIGALDDPYSVFLKPQDAKKFDEDIKGVFGGIGAEINVEKDQLIIVVPLKDNPAMKAGLKAGDSIMKIDDEPTSGMSVEDAVKLIRGEPGTYVRLLIFREGWKSSKEFKVKRDVIKVPTLDWKMVSSTPDGPTDIFYIALHNFNANASQLFREAATDALFQGTNGVILDLRDDTGGYLNVAIDIAGWFLNRGEVIVKERFKNGKVDTLFAHGNGVFKNMPVVIIVNGGSASASEILAGALRDNKSSKLVGEKTYGKGSVQELEYLKDGSTLKISTAEWLTPSNYSINKKGLKPDTEIKAEVTEKKDPYFEKALELIAPLMPKEPALQTIIISI